MARTRRFVAITLAFCLALLAGCTSKPMPSEPVELTVYVWFSTNRDMMDDVAEQYTKQHPNTKVKVKEISGSGQFMSPNAAVDDATLQSGDILLMPLGTAIAMHKAGKLRDLSNLRLPELNELAAALYDDLSMVDGRRFGLPYALNPTVLLLNEARFSRDGVELPPVDWTLEDWADTQAALKAAGSEVNIGMPTLLDPMVRAFGGRMYDPAQRAWVFDTPEAKAGLAWLAKQAQDGAVRLPDGKDLIVVGANERLPAITLLGIEINLPAGLVLQPLPRGPQGRAVPTSAMVAGVLTSSAHPEQATDFVRELIANQHQQAALAQYGLRPVLDDSKVLAAWRERVGDRTADAIDLSLAAAYRSVNLAAMMQATEGLRPYFEGKRSADQVVPGLISQLPHPTGDSAQ